MPQRITRGDAEAVLNAWGTGGRVIVAHRGAVDAGPVDFHGSHGSIRPYPNSAWDGRHFCAEDWHVLLYTWFDGGDDTFNRQRAEDVIGPVTVSFTLDGNALETTRTPIKPFHNPPPDYGMERAWYFQQGKIMSPDDLSVGQHELSARKTDPITGVSDDGITFFIDAAGSGACMGD
jgi:hypothetical protein